MWQIAAQIGMSAVQGWLGGGLAKAQAKAENTINRAKVDADNRVRNAQNAFESAKNLLAQYGQAMANSNRLEAGGEEHNRQLMNYFRQEDQATSMGFEQAIRNAETLGTQRAMAAFAGASPSVADTIQGATALAQARAQQAADQNRDYRNYDLHRRLSLLAQQTVRGLDNTLLLPNQDMTTSYATKVYEPNPWTNALLGAAGTAWKNLPGIANAFQGGAAKFDFNPAQTAATSPYNVDRTL